MTHDSTGSWELPEELRMLRDTIRRFMAQEVKPLEDTLPYDATNWPICRKRRVIWACGVLKHPLNTAAPG
jgi:hypothetical protein